MKVSTSALQLHKYKLVVQYCELNLQVVYLLWSVNNE